MEDVAGGEGLEDCDAGGGLGFRCPAGEDGGVDGVRLGWRREGVGARCGKEPAEVCRVVVGAVFCGDARGPVLEDEGAAGGRGEEEQDAGCFGCRGGGVGLG